PIRVSVAGVHEWAVLEVEDEGQGVSPAELPHIFGLFTQGQQSIDRPKGGIGLGLSLVRHLVELQDGSVVASSEGRGRGARFIVKLPLRQAPEAELEKAPSTVTTVRGQKILLVEDNDDSRTVLSE